MNKIGEKKLKCILFGVTKFAHNTVKESVNHSVCEIIAYADNDSAKQGLIYESVEIIAPEEILHTEFDYILVGAWYSYSAIYGQLTGLGIEGKKIMPLLAVKWIKLLVDSVNHMDKDAVIKIFHNGEQLWEKLEEANEINTLYKSIDFADKDKRPCTDFTEYPLIAHACGGFVNGKKMEYTNSSEAFEEALSAGFQMFECDVWGTQEEQIILGSRLMMQCPISITYQLFSLNLLLDCIAADFKKKVILDIKWNTYDDFYRILGDVEKLAGMFERKGFTRIREQIIIETFEESTTRYAVEKGWECILTDYRNPEGRWLKKTAVLCCRYGIKAVLTDAQMALENLKYIKFLTEKGIQIICYTVDEIEDYARLKQAGVVSILTNYLKPSVK